ncbi:MAG TPA: SRPBCC domain-containing protein [Steroidobacteraceae bacterium]|nr:SRPBCC domain-containing protein [Steroidobacteraceae bacterium]
MSDKERGYAYRVDIRVLPSAVWRALTDNEQLRRWCGPQARISAEQGGLFRASVDKLIEFEAHIDVFVPERRLRLVYLPCAAAPPADTVLVDDFLLEPLADRTTVRLLGSGVPASRQWDTQYLRLRVGWQQAMGRLKVLLERQPKRGGVR